ncbi:Snf7-domain-containing protein [Gaertneriomyces semiglobifer]|nr:Snf7-domain-containing protein [Gaertneriomyces semiglobifer]
MNLFRRAQATKATPKDAIVRLRESLEMLEKRERYLQTKIDNELKIAKVNVSKNKRAALMALKRKKAYEEQIQKIMGSRMTLEQQVMAIENANVNLETMNAMKAGADAMKTIHGALDVNKVDATMDDIREQMDLANEISEAISQPVNFGVEYDEDQLNEELELLEQEDLDARLLDTAGVGAELDVEAAPSVPSAAVPAIAQPPRPTRAQRVQSDEDKELEELRAAMAL